MVPKLSHFLPSRLVRLSSLDQIKKLTLADLNFYQPGTIDMIIGSDFLLFISCDGLKCFDGCLEARSSQFGWYIAGPAPLDDEHQSFSTTVNEDMDLIQQLQKFWYLEEIEIPKSQLEKGRLV